MWLKLGLQFRLSDFDSWKTLAITHRTKQFAFHWTFQIYTVPDLPHPQLLGVQAQITKAEFTDLHVSFRSWILAFVFSNLEKNEFQNLKKKMSYVFYRLLTSFPYILWKEHVGWRDVSEDQSLVPNTHVRQAATVYNSSSRNSNTSGTFIHMHIPVQSHTYHT